jgi:HD-GYP domain-containing protein (c-di-GMP phosphodiesterase class II)
LGLTAEEADLIESAGRVHDLGKVAVDPNVLMKTSKLDEDEWAQMKLHPVYGADVVAQFAAYREGTELVRHHHERVDGLGYPDGLVGDAIPLGARILAVADTFDALTSDRPYRRGMEVERATAILQEGAGTQWDERVVAALLGVLAATPERVPLYRSRTEAAAREEPAGVWAA